MYWWLDIDILDTQHSIVRSLVAFVVPFDLSTILFCQYQSFIIKIDVTIDCLHDYWSRAHTYSFDSSFTLFFFLILLFPKEKKKLLLSSICYRSLQQNTDSKQFSRLQTQCKMQRIANATKIQQLLKIELIPKQITQHKPSINHGYHFQ